MTLRNQFSSMKATIFLLALLPLDRLIWLGFTDGLGANPIEFITRSTGTWALVFLCLTLAMTPLRLLTNSTSWIRYRRILGLFSFFYACLHFGIWLWLDQDFDLVEMLRDVGLTSSQLQALAVRSHTRMLPCWSPAGAKQWMPV